MLMWSNTTWQSYKCPNSSSRVQPYSFVSESRLPTENETKSSVGNLLYALILQCPVHWLFFLLPISLPWAFIKMPAVFCPLLCWTWAEILRVKHRSPAIQINATEQGDLLSRMSAPSRNSVCWQGLCIFTCAYTGQVTRTSNALNRLKKLFNSNFSSLYRLMARWTVSLKLISRNSYHLLNTY